MAICARRSSRPSPAIASWLHKAPREPTFAFVCKVSAPRVTEQGEGHTLTNTQRSRLAAGSLAHRAEEIDLDRVYREHAGAVSRWARRLTGTNEASDVVQEVFEIAQRRLSDFRGDAQITTWLYAITVRVVSARRRKARLRRLLFLEARAQFELDTDPATTPTDELQRGHATRVVYTVLDQLSERDRTLLVLFELESLATSEISGIMGMTENNVSVSLHRARERFRSKLARAFPNEASK